MQELDDLLKTPLDVENGNELAKQLSLVESWSGLVSSKYRAASKELAEMRNKFMMPKEKGVTDMDRGVHIEAATRDWQESVDRLSDYQDIIRRRISLGQTLLKSINTEMESGLK